MKKIQFKMTRRQVLKAGLAGGAGLMLPWRFLPARAFAAALNTGVKSSFDLSGGAFNTLKVVYKFSILIYFLFEKSIFDPGNKLFAPSIDD
jgi:hypothetical protein